MTVTRAQEGARWKAVITAAFLLLAGGVSGVLLDRLWLRSHDVEPMPLTAQAMAARLDLTPAEETRMRALLDSMHAEVTAAAHHGPDSLAVTARRAHQRIEAALPSAARAEFRAWMQDHHRQLMRRMGSGSDGDRAHHP
jgi:hypothetical protein